uniref:Ubiquitin carboxyl-terminal hydrolase n=1 Tax=Saccoglossus kowalevskii TaxID=10224 RepID=A0ABM0M9B4_SACKO|nr:PREDICTED: ubiquitin carboxyl-terminal hydrolase isozyme L3-like [Saccoglossus kowalevskii]
MASKPRWLPLESNPDVMNKFVHQLGMSKSWQFCDVYGLDPDLLGMVPSPVAAVLLLFPINEKYETFKKEEEEKIDKDGQTVSSNLYYMKQTIGNACGTIGLLHAIANNKHRIELDGSLKKFIDDTEKMSPAERAEYLEKDESISAAHESSAQEGQTEVILQYNLVWSLCLLSMYQFLDYVCFEFQDAAGACKAFMARDPAELHFTVVALAKAQ